MLVQYQKQKSDFSGRSAVDAKGFEGWVMQEGAMGIIGPPPNAVVPGSYVERGDTFHLGADFRSIGTGRIEAWAQYMPGATPESLHMVLGAGNFEGSGDSVYFSDTAPDGFSTKNALHRVFQQSSSSPGVWKTDLSL